VNYSNGCIGLDKSEQNRQFFDWLDDINSNLWLNPNELDIKDESGIWWNNTWMTTRTVRVVWAARKFSALSNTQLKIIKDHKTLDKTKTDEVNLQAKM